MISEYNSVKETLRDLLEKSAKILTCANIFQTCLAVSVTMNYVTFGLARTEKSKQNPTMFTIQKKGKIATSRMCGKR